MAAPATLSVGCKLPAGLIVTHAKKTVFLRGSNSSNVIGGFGLTEGVDSDWYNDWTATHSDFAPLKRGMIFANGSTASAKSQAAERETERNGFEGVNPDKPAPGIERVATTPA